MSVPGNFTVYRSSAGSGKTFTLVREYLRIALADPKRFRNILAITFTNKAAAEMKNRVLKYLTDLNAPHTRETRVAHEVLLPQLSMETGLPETEIILRAGEVLSLILHQYSDFAITTIDALMHKVIRTFTFDLKLSSSFTIEMDLSKLLMEAANSLISKAGTDAELTSTLVAFVRQQTNTEKNFHIEKDIFSLSKRTYDLEGTREYLEKLRNYNIQDLLRINQELMTQIRQFESGLQTIAKEAHALMTANHLNPARFYYGKNGSIGQYFSNIAMGRFDKIEPGSHVKTTIEKDKWPANDCDEVSRERIARIKDTLRELYLRMQDLIAAGHRQYVLNKLCTRYFYPLILLTEVHKILSEIRQEENLLLISDFNHLISRVVETESVPFIYERMGIRYKHFMIDEFQDTSILQWRNLIPLLENMLADGNYCMLVGDGKQAIYRWRNGEVAQFAELPKIYRNPGTPDYMIREQALVRNYQEEHLSTNYRSSEVIVRFNNELYEFLSGSLKEKNRNIYLNHDQSFSPGQTGGYVEIGFNHYTDEETEVPEKIIALIGNIREDGYALQDIGILCRSNRQASNIASKLLQNGIRVISAESLLLDGNPGVSFLISCLGYLEDTGNKIARAAIVRYLHLHGKFPGLPLHDVLSKANQGNGPFLALLKEHGYVLHQLDLLKMPVYDLAEALIRMFGLNQLADPYLQFFLDMVREYSVTNGHEGSGFLDYWEEKKGDATIKVPAGVEAVNVVTIHKSKGLEFPVVILPGKDEIKGNTIGLTWAELDNEGGIRLPAILLSNSKDLLQTPFEELYETENAKTRLDFINLLYVATTRAARQLYILLGKPSKNPSNMNSVQDLFASWLHSQGIWQENRNLYTYGQRQKNEMAVPSTSTGTGRGAMISNAWQHRAILSMQYPSAAMDPDVLQKIAWGNNLHLALSRLTPQNPPEEIVKEMLGEGLITEDQSVKLSETLIKILAHPEVHTLFSSEGTHFTEAEIIGEDGSSHRPDRVTVSKDGVTLIDFKTGEPDEAHHRQLERYGKLLEDMGYANIRKVLIYVSDEIRVCHT